MSTEQRPPSSPTKPESRLDRLASGSDGSPRLGSRRAESAPGDPRSPEPRRVVLTEDGPALIDGPIELVTTDGTVLHCDRFVVALCLCRRSSTYPLCDTSHRRRHRRRSA